MMIKTVMQAQTMMKTNQLKRRNGRKLKLRQKNPRKNGEVRERRQVMTKMLWSTRRM